ncbi:hypothetical protein BJ546DRAFT_951017 [Cryomyces antarcticus]
MDDRLISDRKYQNWSPMSLSYEVTLTAPPAAAQSLKSIALISLDFQHIFACNTDLEGALALCWKHKAAAMNKAVTSHMYRRQALGVTHLRTSAFAACTAQKPKVKMRMSSSMSALLLSTLAKPTTAASSSVQQGSFVGIATSAALFNSTMTMTMTLDDCQAKYGHGWAPYDIWGRVQSIATWVLPLFVRMGSMHFSHSVLIHLVNIKPRAIRVGRTAASAEAMVPLNLAVTKLAMAGWYNWMVGGALGA